MIVLKLLTYIIGIILNKNYQKLVKIHQFNFLDINISKDQLDNLTKGEFENINALL
jgi:hypothetical protein